MESRIEVEALAKALLVTTLRFDPQLKRCNTNPTVAGRPTSFYMLTYHHQRLIEAAECLGFSKAIESLGSIKSFQRALEDSLNKACKDPGGLDNECFRVRVALGRDGDVDISSQPIPHVSLSTLYPDCLTGYDRADENSDIPEKPATTDSNAWAVLISPTRSTASAITTFKHDQRAIYNSARENVQAYFDKSLFSNFEALLIDEHDRILDGAITAVYFRRNGAWVTPPTGTGQGRWGGLKSVTRRWAIDHGLAIEEHVDALTVVEGEKVWLSNGARGFFPGVIVRNPLRTGAIETKGTLSGSHEA